MAQETSTPPPQPEPQAQAEPQTPPEPQAQSEPQAQPEPYVAFRVMRMEVELESETRPSVESDSDSDVQDYTDDYDSDYDSDADSDSDMEIEVEVNPEAEAAPTPGAQPGPTNGPTAADPAENPTQGWGPTQRYPRSAINSRQGRETTVRDMMVDRRWPRVASAFLDTIPRNDAEWSRLIIHPHQVTDVTGLLRLTHVPRDYSPADDWSGFFGMVLIKLACLKFIPAVASLFSIVVVGACQVALIEGCSKAVINRTLRSVLVQRGFPESYITEEDLIDLRLGVLNGIDLMDEYAAAIGPRANEFPLYFTDALFLFQNCTPSCFNYLLAQVSSLRRPSRDMRPSRRLAIPALVSGLLGGSGSTRGVTYEDVSGILRFNGVMCPFCDISEPYCCDRMENLVSEYPDRRLGYEIPMTPRMGSPEI